VTHRSQIVERSTTRESRRKTQDARRRRCDPFDSLSVGLVADGPTHEPSMPLTLVTSTLEVRCCEGTPRS
jgi:hypothetical protein